MNFRCLKWLYCAFLYLTVSWLSGQHGDRLTFRHIGKEEGLVQSSVFAIAQDSTGLLWFGTRGGLARYDGYRFKNFHHPLPSANDVRTLYVDPTNSDLWVGSLTTLTRYRDGGATYTTYQHDPADAGGLGTGSIRDVFRDSAGRLWVATSTGLHLWEEASARFRLVAATRVIDGAQSSHVAFITESPRGELFVGTRTGLFHMTIPGNKPSEATYREVAELHGQHLQAKTWDDEGHLWLGTNAQGVIKWAPETGATTRFQYREEDEGAISDNNIRSLLFDRHGNLWAATFKGLSFLEKGGGQFVRYRRESNNQIGLQDNSVWALLSDQAGALWIGTYYGGVHHLDDRYNSFNNYHYLPNTNSLTSDHVSSFAEEPSGDLWVGTEGGGLNLLNAATGRFTSYTHDTDNPTSISSNNVKKILLEGDSLWVGTYRGGLNLFNRQTGTFSHFRAGPAGEAFSLTNDNVYDLHREGQRLWVLTFGGGLNIIDLRTGKVDYHFHDPANKNSLVSNDTRTLLKSKTGAYWVGTENGLSHIETDQKGQPATFTTHLKSEKIYAIHENDDGSLFLGTFSSGLCYYNPRTGEAKRYTTTEGLPGNTVFGLIKTDDNFLWLSTDNGLSRFNVAQATSTNYDFSHGLENLEFNFNAYELAHNGDLLFGGFSGFTRFNPKALVPNTYVPPIVMTGLRYRNRPVAVGGEDGLLTRSINETESLTFAYNDANFTLEFAALDYFSPENNQYAYKLEGLDNDWNYSTGETEANYTIQREGDYTFLLKAANNDGVWNDRIKRISIKVLPPVWRTWWAYLIYGALCALAIYAVVHLLRLRHRVQLQEIAKRQQEELTETKLRFFTNITHELRTPLTLILAPLRELAQSSEHTLKTKRQLSLIERNAQRLLDLVNQVLTFRKLVSDHEPLSIRELPLRSLIDDVYASFTDIARLRSVDYTLEFSTTAESLWLDRDKIEIVFYNLLSNAFKFTPDGGAVRVIVEDGDFGVTVRVRDSGVGVSESLRKKIFRRFYEKSTGQQFATKNSGIGLAISRQMVDLHHGRIYVNDNLGADAGAEFVVELRKGNTHFDGQAIINLPPLEVSPLAKEVITLAPSAGVIATPPTPDGPRRSILIVEDNPEIRAYITSLFTEDYTVLEADNGAAGLAQARAHRPDVIVSDVMMPEMHGLEFCHRLKSDLNLSHIPLILLTARAAEPFRIEGLRQGADDYLTKPFHPEELRLRVRNILLAREQAREKFVRVLSLEPREITITNADEDFLEAALASVEAHIGDYDFKLEALASDLAVSRSLLFTKLKALTGQTPNNFVKTVRLKRAAQLLEGGQLNVSEVAYRVGFRDPKYFRKVFKAHFKEVPSNYGKSG